MRAWVLTTIAMIAFAANSVLTRLALAEDLIGAGGFTLVRLVSGAAMLVAILVIRRQRLAGSWFGALALLTYAGFFSYAYIALPAGTGAIILFAMVQITMLGWAIIKGDWPGLWQWLGLALAMIALVWLVSPGLAAPPLVASLAMMIAGLGWGAYSLLGKGAGNPGAATTGNFLRAAFIALVLAAPLFWLHPETAPAPAGLVLAVISGALTSGVGYVIWYAALKYLSATRAGIAQLTVPAIAALGGIVFLNEPITLRFALASSGILAGVALAVLTPAAGSRKGSG